MGDAGFFLLSLSILAPAGIGVARWTHLRREFMPLLLLLGVGVLQEVCTHLFFYEGNEAEENIYFLIEALLYCWLFRGWKHVLRRRSVFYAVLSGLAALWVLENFVLHSITGFHPLFQVVYSLCLVFFAVDEMNWLIVNEHGQIITNTRFIICISVILYFAYKAAAEVFYHYAENDEIKRHIFAVEALLNVAFNFLISFALLCVPRKIDFTSRY